MKTIPLFQVDAFADQLFKGNPAAVCVLEDWLPDETLQAIAEENNLSETAFLVGEGTTSELRWFTPAKEVDLCGHATLAAAFVLFSRYVPDEGTVSFQTRSGRLAVERTGERLTLDFPVIEPRACDVPKALEEALSTDIRGCWTAMDFLVLLPDEASMRAVQPDFRRLMALDTRGVIITAPGENADFVSRYFAPNYGIDEDPVTGSAHCMLVPFWAKRLEKTRMQAIQLSKRRGHLQCELAGNRVKISGKAVMYLEGNISALG